MLPVNGSPGMLSVAEKAQKAQGESLPTFLASLATSVILCTFVVIIYVAVKPKLLQAYRSGTYLRAALQDQTAAAWPRMILFPMPDPDPGQTRGLENYLFDRYIHTILRIFVLLTLTLMPILLPLNLIGGKNESNGIKGLDRLSFANVGITHANWYWVHMLLAIFVVMFVCMTLRFELQNYTRFQEAAVATQVEGSTILLVSTSRNQLTFESIQQHFSTISGGIRSIKMNRDYKSMHDKVQQRVWLIAKLEAAETYLIRRAQLSKTRPVQSSRGEGMDQLLWRKYLCAKDRPSMRLPIWDVIPSLPFIGTKVDTIYHCRSEIIRYSLEIERDQQQLHTFPLLNSAFIYFNHRISISLPLLALKTQTPPSWTLKHGTIHNDIIWSNVSVGRGALLIRTIIIYVLVVVLILGYGFPVTITGSLSQISYLANVIPGLSSVNAIPSWLIAVIQGVLPPTLLALITALVPTILRILANLHGLYSRQAVEHTLQTYYFAFLFVQAFIVVSLSASIATVIEELRYSVESVPALLVQNLPKASNYFFSYLIIHTSATVTSTLTLPIELISILLSSILDKTARQKWTRRENLHLKKWGTFVPVYTNLACIGLIYSVIAPIILVIGVIVFGTLWILYRNTPPRLSDSHLNGRGQFYPVAIHQIFTGLYFMELSLAGLFFLVRDSDGGAACTRQAIIMTIATVITIIFHSTINYDVRLCWRALVTIFKSLIFRHRQKNEKDRCEGRGRPGVQFSNTTACIDNENVSAGPVMWIPQDSLGVAVNEIYHMRKYSVHLAISTKGASLDRDSSIVLRAGPPN